MASYNNTYDILKQFYLQVIKNKIKENDYKLGSYDTISESVGKITIIRQTGYFIGNSDNVSSTYKDDVFACTLTGGDSIISDTSDDTQYGFMKILNGSYIVGDPYDESSAYKTICCSGSRLYIKAASLDTALRFPLFIEYKLATATTETIDLTKSNYITQNEKTLLKDAYYKTLNKFDIFKWTSKSDYVTVEENKISFAVSNNTNTGQVFVEYNGAVCYGNSVGSYSKVFTKSNASNDLYIKRNGNNSDYGIHYDISFIPNNTKFRISYYVSQMNASNSKPSIATNFMITLGEDTNTYSKFYGDIVHEKHEQLLWANANPSSSFSSVNITTLNSSAYKYLIIQYKQDSSSSFALSSIKIRNVAGTYCLLSGSEYASSTMNTQSRQITINSSSSITIGSGFSNNSSNNYKLVPVAIYGTNVL